MFFKVNLYPKPSLNSVLCNPAKDSLKILTLHLLFASSPETGAQKIATPARVDGRLTGHVTFYEQELLSRYKSMV